MPRGFVAAAFVVIVSGALVHGEFRTPDLQNVPVSRLTANLERMIAENPADLMLRINLARAHAMAYAQKTEKATVLKGREQYGVYAEHVPIYHPFEVKKAATEAARTAAAIHLDAAIAAYQDVISRAPDNLIARLGLAWSLDQAGQKARAIAEYRIVVRDGFPKDRSKDRYAPPVLRGDRYLSEEAARYLLPLLDPTNDRGEIATLKAQIAELEKAPRGITPIAVPLKDGLSACDVTNTDARVVFDADGTGVDRSWTWITPDAAWLVFDKQDTRRVTSALQLFGNVTFWMFWENGYRALGGLDDNSDGRIAGPELPGLALWRDANANGISEPGEVRPVSDWKIVSLSYRYEFDATHPDEIAFSPAGVTFADGTTRPTWDIVLHHQQAPRRHP
jgi:tetratricopeptide (TPR) repeat protein